MISGPKVLKLIELSEKALQAGTEAAWDEMASLDLQRRELMDNLSSLDSSDGKIPSPTEVDTLLSLDQEIIELVQHHADEARAAYLSHKQKNSAVGQYQTAAGS